MKKTNFDRYLDEQLQDPAFAARFQQAGEAWGVALQPAALREQAGLTQRELARKLKTSQQQISRLESPGCKGHSLSMLRRRPLPAATQNCVTEYNHQRGGLGKAHQLFGEQLPKLLAELNDVLAA
ncbi:MAG: XRE family transcriptional regulator [Proteobacteria bacterium]|jgi:hypothetical protein|nr:XRE family transcriptional regulator [Pseudomonadota bacterium]